MSNTIFTEDYNYGLSLPADWIQEVTKSAARDLLDTMLGRMEYGKSYVITLHNEDRFTLDPKDDIAYKKVILEMVPVEYDIKPHDRVVMPRMESGKTGKLIDADALIESLSVDQTECPGCPEPEFLGDLIDVLESAPAAK